MNYSFISTRGKHIAPKNRNGKRIIAAALVAILTFSLALPVLAVALAENTPKQEVVYINLHADGTVSEIYVVNSFELNEDGQIIDYGDYTALRNMTTNDEIKFEDETVRIDTKARKLYYEGKLNSDIIPWNFSIRYYLDGQEYPAKELAGKSGALKITIAIRKNPDCNSTFFENYGLQASLTLDTELCKNIIAEEATAASVGKNRQLTYTILPNSEKDFLITADVVDFEMPAIAINGLPLNMDVEVDTENNAALNEEIDNLEDAVAELDDGATELNDGAGDLLDGAGELKDGVTELQDGVSELFDGAVELRDGATELNDGVINLDNGASELQDGAGDLSSGVGDLLNGAAELRDGASDLTAGAQELTDGIKEAVDGALELYNGISKIKDGADDLYSGANLLYDGLNTLDGQSNTLVNGAYSVFEELTAQAEQQVNSSLTAAGMSTIDLTPENYSTVLSNLLDTLSGGAYTQAVTVAEGNIRTQVETAVAEQVAYTIRNDTEILAQIDAGVETDYGAEIDTNAQSYVAFELAKATVSNADPVPDDVNTAAQTWLESQDGQIAIQNYLAAEDGQAAVFAAREEIKKQYMEAAITQQIETQMQSEEVAAQIEAAVAEQLASDEVQAQISEAVNSALGTNEAYQGVIALKEQLDSYNAFYLGLQQYTAGVGTAAEGAYDLMGGASTLSDGANDLYAGMETLYNGLLELQSGSAELRSGTITLHDGAIELYNGVLELKDGATELLNGTIELKDGTAELLNGVIELKDGTITLYNGAVELKDGVVELLDGAIELYDGTVELRDGTVELKDGTFEFRDKTANLDTELKDKINNAITGMLSGDFDVISFVSDKNANVEAVQFVIQTEAISIDDAVEIDVIEEAPLTFWQKLLRLFGLY